MGVVVKQRIKGKGQPWWIFINHQGKRKSKKVGDKQAAEKVASAIRQKLAKGELDLSDKKAIPTFGECAEKWLNGYIKGMRLESTFERYQGLLNNHVLPVFRDTPLDRITRGDVRDFLVSKIGEGLSRSTICILRDVLNGTFHHAVDEEIISASPVSGITKRLELKRTRKEIHPLTRDELALFLDTCNKYYPEHYPFFLMAARTGMRLGELLAVRWGDIDFNSRFISVRQSYRRGQFSTPKNKKDRQVDMSDQLAQALKTLLTQRRKEGLQRGVGEVPELVFHRDSGQVIEQNYIRRVFKRILKKVGLREIRIHDLRHTFASLLLSQGESPVYVKDQLGHSGIQITVNVYGHLIPGENKKAVNLLDDTSTRNLSATKPPKANLTTCNY